MSADVRILRLIRKTIFGEESLPASSTREINEYFATDYFDIMRVEKGEVSASFTSMLGILPEEVTSGVDIAIHGFSLFCSEDMMKAEKENARCNDPFQSMDNKMPFLSVIQIHIAPEVIARFPKKESAEQFMRDIYQDLHEAMKEYDRSSEHKNENYMFRIYKMLSVGDFAIVVRSGNEEISFKISSYLRRRVLKNKKYVLYKTYTIFTLGDEIIQCNFDEQSNAREDRFVLRCCYSNLYWRDRETVGAYLRKNRLSFDDRPYGLNGRYDFSVRVNRKQFLELLPDIRKYKEAGQQKLPVDFVDECDPAGGDESTKSQTESDDIVKYMRYLMENSYLSYINERYLVAQEEAEDVTIKNNISTLSLEEAQGAEEAYLEQKITKLFRKVKKNYDSICGEINRNVAYRKNILYYMRLLGKQINRYYGINGFSDTRIYAAMLLKQIEMTLRSINEYVVLYEAAVDEGGSEESEKGAMLSRLEDDIREAVCALDSYAQYIRSRNLQSLQTPNYNLESEMSLEKMLIGYSEFIKTFMDFYAEWGEKEEQEKSEWFPVVVPRLIEKDVSVRKLFPKGKMNDWECEKKIREKCQNGYECNTVVISVPIIAKLGNVETMVTSLIHEMAHQFRYEKRKIRNDALLKYLVHNVMQEIVNDMLQKIMEETGTVDYYFRFGKNVVKILMEVYLELNYRKDGKMDYSFQEAPLNNFEYCFRKDLYENFDGWERKSQLDDAFQGFLKKVVQYYPGEDRQLLEAVKVMDELIEEAKEDENVRNADKEGKDLYEQIVSCAFGLSWMCAYKRKHPKESSFWEENRFRKWVQETETESPYEDIWSKTFSKASLKVSKDDAINTIYKNFHDYAIWIYTNCGNRGKARDYKNTKKSEFLKEAYKRLCQEWRADTLEQAIRANMEILIKNSSQSDENGVPGTWDEFPILAEWEETEDPHLFQLCDRIDDLKEYCDQAMDLCKNIVEKESYEKLKLYGIIANMLSQLMPAASEHISYLNEFAEIRDDYITGVETLKGLGENMCKSDLGHKDSSGRTMVSKVGELCRQIGRWQNEPYFLQKNEEERQKRNICSIEFLLDLYYENRRRIVREIGE